MYWQAGASLSFTPAAVSCLVRENRAALDIRLTDQDHAELDRAFTPPKRPRPLELL